MATQPMERDAAPSQDAAATSDRQAWDVVVDNDMFLRSFWDSAPDAMVLSDAEGIVWMANPAYCALYGYSPEEIIGHSFALIFPPEQRPSALDQYRIVFEGGNATPLHETWIRRKDGTSRYVQARAEVIVQDGQPRAMLSIIRDITEHWAREQALRDFLAVTSHELRNSLTIINGGGQLMRRRGVYDERALERIISQATHMQRLLGDLLEVANPEAGRMHIVRGPVDLVALARSCAEQAGSQTERHSIRVEPDGAQIEGMWDGDRLRQVIDNLLSNAIKYSPGGGEVVVRVDDLGADVRLSVRDCGVGIPSEAVGRIFDRFYRAEGAAAAASGFGIGLFVAQSIVELHDGRMAVESAPGHGSTFSFTLPRTGRAEA